MLPFRTGACAAVSLAALALAPAPARAADSADLIVRGARIHTSDPSRPEAQAMAVRGDRIVYVGSDEGAQAWRGRATQVLDLHGARVLPGLVDAHIHPIDIVPVDGCDLESKAMSLSEITAFVRACAARYKPAPGGWLDVAQWNFSNGNQPDAHHPSLRAALDAAAPGVAVQLQGNDGHHGAFSSAALARASTRAGETVGLSRASLAGPLAAYRPLVGVDAAGEPNGTVNEEARALMGAADPLVSALPEVMKAPERVMAVLNADGITAIQDAYVTPQMVAFYDALEAKGALTVRANLAQFYDPDVILKADGSPDYDAMVAQAVAIRDHFKGHPLIRADAVKLFADGVMEGDPYATPPTPPESPSIKPYLAPIFGRDAKGLPRVTGYVDQDSPACRTVRDRAEATTIDPAATAAFIKANGFHPAQCAPSSGRLQHPRAVILEYLRRMHLAGFTLHVHTIGDAAVRAAVDGIEAARAADGVTTRPDTIAHAQIVTPQDVARIGRDHLFVAFTYAWAYTDPEYDLTVIPFLQRVDGEGYAALHPRGGAYDRDAYPVRALQRAGAIAVAGSDAPVDTRDPRPFVNMQYAVLRAEPGQPPLGPKEALDLPAAIAAYTLDGARALGRADEIGSLTVGKSADFIVLDRDILALAAAGHADTVGETKVLQTWFRGRRVFAAPPATRSAAGTPAPTG